ncbi:MAG: CPBP family intramembrane metalloprotease [Nanoarchaeota archaeon]|nr:CPBP family intramembrane metalloprotease [Nanoarchaeota archaeon]
MLFNFRSFFDFEKKSVFLINFFLILLFIVFLVKQFKLIYFFYIDVFLTLGLSYFFFKRSRHLAKMLIVTNMFIFFYFLFPLIAEFVSDLLGNEAYIFIMFYNVVVAYIFLKLSGFHENFLGNLKNFKLTFIVFILVLGMSFGLFFHMIKEPVPSLFIDFSENSTINLALFLVFNSFIVALSEQMIFSGFLFNVYRNLTSKFDAYFQVSIIFILFHLLRFRILVEYYYVSFAEFYIFYLTAYYIFLFFFMLTALYLYSFIGKKYQGNFFYPVFLHFGADFGLFMFYLTGL